MRQPRIKGFPHMLVGYMRVSSADDRQSVDLRRDALTAAAAAVARRPAPATTGPG